MNITQSTKGDNLISIKISVEKADYQEEVEKSLKQLKHRANIPGFRPGMVPMGMIKENYAFIILDAAYLAILPGIAIMLLVLAFMLIGNALREALDVKN